MAQRLGGGLSLHFHDPGTRRGWVVSSTPRPHFTPRKDPVPIVQEAGWASGVSLDGRKISSPPGFDPGLSISSSVTIPTELPQNAQCNDKANTVYAFKVDRTENTSAEDLIQRHGVTWYHHFDKYYMPSFSRVSKTWTYWRLKMKVVISFETSGPVYLVTQPHITE